MVQDVIKGDATLPVGDDMSSPLDERLVNLENAVDNLDQVVKNLQIIAGEAEGLEGERTEGTEEGRAEDAPEHTQKRISLTQLLGGIDIKQMQNDVTTLKVDVSRMKDEMKQVQGKIAKTKTELAQKVESMVEVQKEQKKEQKEQKEQKKEEKEEKKEQKKEQKKEPEPAETDDEEPKVDETKEDVTMPRKGTVKEKVESPKSPTEKIDIDISIDSEDLDSIRGRISKLEKDVSCLFEKVESAPMAGVAGTADIEDLVAKIHEIQTEMEKLNQTADRLIDDRENREMHLNALLEQVELLKTLKADREDLEDALAEKADAHAINRKVSYDQFDAACDDLAQGLEDAIGKLGQQEAIWQQALDEVQKEIEGKVDKMEMSPLKDFVNHRLKSLQEKLKAISEARQELEAAGTKKLLRDVQCISCDKDVVMRMDPDRRFKVDGFPCSLSMKPYLTYELDQVRKQRKRLPHSRNMIQFEAAMQEETKKQRSARDPLDKTPRDHLCNRYCGGSHTVTTPQQRVMRVGHFLTQWGPEIVQLTEGMIKGTDGKMYKGRRMLNKIDVCGPSYCSDHGDEIRSMDRPSITATVSSRKSSERQTSSTARKRPTRRRSREISKEVIEEVSEAPVEETDQESDAPTDTVEPPGHMPRYIDEEEMGEQD
ncbi:glutamine-rich protein 2-like [Ceratina calcarata]|uniref:Glutamine-rich protein 2-like n=1 Tax=Ceratina calcarata TaxID=156304 RepID=A0AAJ7SB97_9HYME|nr:glutamine-rich protein 2-like [Ceratina calcarata]